MKKFIWSIFLIGLVWCIFFTPCFASGSENVTFSCYTTTSLTKSVSIKSAYNVTINWGDGKVDTSSATTEEVKMTHTYSSAGNYKVSISSEGITKLNVSSNDIYSLDISNLSSLEELNCSNNKLEELVLTLNTSLKSLKVYSNKLNSLTIPSKLIETLDCSNNQLVSLTVNSTIKNLNFNNNNIVSFDTSNFSNLQALECENNYLSSLNVSDCSQLQKLNISNNFITDISLENNTGLTEIYCFGNELQALDISGNTELEILNCISNKITSLEVDNNTKLKELYIFNNEIESLDLKSINLTRTIVDDIVDVSNNNSELLIKLKIEGDGDAGLDGTDILFSSVPVQLFVNDSQQANPVQALDISGYTGVTNIKAVFSERSEQISINLPQLDEGMIPVKHNGTNWVITNEADEEWYDYSKTSMKWANVMLRDDAYYLDVDGKTPKEVGTTALENLIGKEVPENYTGSMYVWIPRYTYKILENGIDIKYTQGLDDDTEDGYKVHPGFNYASYLGGDTSDINNYLELNGADKNLGLWVAKYPAGGSKSSPKYTKNSSKLSEITIGDAFLASKVTATASKYGLSNATSHLMKNSEWGAIAYFTTAVGNLSGDSTTGNIYGIYGMDSGAEYVSSFVELVGGISNFSVRKNGKSLLPYNIISYTNHQVADEKDIEIIKLTSALDDITSNYKALEVFWGNGISEVNSNITGDVTQSAPYGSNAFLARGIDGIYSYFGTNGSAVNSIGFRNIIKNVSASSEESVPTFIIKSTSQEGGKISPEGNTVVKSGKNITYSIIPNPGFEVIDVLVDNVSVYSDLDKHDTYCTYEFVNVTSSHTITAVFDGEVEQYSVSVEKNPNDAGNIIGDGLYYSRSTVTLTAEGEKGYKFSSWEIKEGLTDIDSTSKVVSFKMPSNNVILQANFVEALKSVLTVENLYGKLKMEKYDGTDVVVTATENAEYVFSHWEATGIELTDEQLSNNSIAFKMPKNDVYLVANYDDGKYTVTFDPNDGTGNVTTQNFTYNKSKSLTKNTFTKTGYYFTGWATTPSGEVEYKDEQDYTATKDITLYAVWEEIVYGDVNGNGEVDIRDQAHFQLNLTNDEKLNDGSIIKEENNIIWENSDLNQDGYVNHYDFWILPQYYMSSADTSKPYTGKIVTFSGTEKLISSSSYQLFETGEEKALAPSTSTNLTKSGYTLVGWSTTYGGEVEYQLGANYKADDNLTLYAVWESDTEETTYTITYNLDGGTVSTANPTTYTASETFTLNNPTKTGYTFTGWTGSNGTTPSTTVTIEKETTGNLTYTANWTVKTYAVRFNKNDGTGMMANQTFTHGVSKALTANGFSKSNYTFIGWAESSTGKPVYADEATMTLTADKILYAYWVADGTTTLTLNGNTTLTAPDVSTISSINSSSGTSLTAGEKHSLAVGTLLKIVDSKKVVINDNTVYSTKNYGVGTSPNYCVVVLYGATSINKSTSGTTITGDVLLVKTGRDSTSSGGSTSTI